MKRLVALAAVGALTACSSGGTSPVITIIKEAVLPSKTEDAPTAPSTGPLTREKIESYGLALIRAQIAGEETRNLLTGTSLNDHYVTFVSSYRQTITLLGSLVTSTRGLGGDLLAVDSSANDPIALLTPVKDWPTEIIRTYTFPADSPEGDTFQVFCELTKGTPTTLELVEMTYEVTPVSEFCATDGFVFTNTYMAETLTGQIWTSQQWVGDDIGYLNIEILEPITFD